MSVIDTQIDTVTSTINIDESAVALALSPDGSTLYVANLEAALIAVVNTASDTVENYIDDDIDQPYALTLAADGAALYVAGFNNPGVQVYDTTDDAPAGTVAVGELASSLLVDAATGALYGNNGLDDGPTANGVSWESSSPPTISLPVTESAPVAGQTLTAVPGAWLPMDDLTYQWLADGQQISGATSPTLTLTSDEVGDEI